jgi:hypothetical protein
MSANILPSTGLMNTSLTSFSIFSCSKRPFYAVSASHFSYGLFQGRIIITNKGLQPNVINLSYIANKKQQFIASMQQKKHQIS